MKYSEFHRKIIRNGWTFSHAEGSHYFYKKDGKLSQSIPFHGATEMGNGLIRKLTKLMNLK